VENRELAQAEWDYQCAVVLLREMQVRHQVDGSTGSPRQQAMIDVQLCSIAENKAMAEFQRAREDSARVQLAHEEGHCGAAIVIEAAARRCLGEMVLRQCQLDLERLEKSS
jgi:hypothetical protein